MRGFVFPIGTEADSVDPIEIDDTVGVGVFRKDETEGNVQFRMGDRTVDLGHHDISVSRLRPDGAPVRFSKEDGELYVRNVDNESPVEIDYLRSEETLEKGTISKIHSNCIVRPGYHTELMVTLDSGDTTYPIIRATCIGLNHAVRNSDHAAITTGRTLHKTMREHPIDDEEYDEYVEELDRELDDLEDSNELRDGTQLGEERIKAIERLTSGIKDMYMYNI